MTDDHFDVFDVCDGRHNFHMIPPHLRFGGFVWQCAECGAKS